ncbi:MAG TPA: choice-of-anchor X domain-containing protein, partial [Candidatus Eisenbacteria bacterium]|nr:choice-of-anchor X domain-containing protein [Candidatus Eisenbacteria bacterium]
MPVRLWILAALFVLAGCSTGTEDVELDNPFDPNNSGSLPVPDSIIVTLGSNVVRLDWSIEPGSQVDQYAIFRQRVDADPPESEKRIATVTSRSYEDRQVRDGRIYLYRIAAGKDGRFGSRSEAIEARPTFFAISLSGGAPRTRLVSVPVSPTGPALTTAIQLGESSNLSSAVWVPISTDLVWVLSQGDGLKRVYARFRLQDGSTSFPVSSEITLDTRAVIREVDFVGADVRAPGEILHVRLDAGEQGTASVSIGTLFTNLALLDDGSGGDATAGDGIYERDVPLPYVVTNQINLTGRF